MAVTVLDGTRQIKASSITNASQNFGTPASATDVAIKSYVDSVAQGLSVKPSAYVATTAALSPANTYAAGVLTATGNGVLTVDGATTALNDYILVKNEASSLKNGLYKVTTAGTVGVPYVLTRAVEMDVSSEFTGAFVFVESGNINVSSGWVCTTIAPTVGTTGIFFSQFSGAGELIAGNGISISANTISIDTSITVDETSVQTLTNKSLTSPAITTPTGIVKGDVGLGSVDNTADAAKSVLSATKWTTSRTLGGNSVDGSANVAFANKFIAQGTADSGLSGAQFLGALGTGIVKNTTTSGVLSIAVNSDLPVMTATVGGAVPTPPNNTTTFLRGDGTFATPSGGGDMLLASVQTVTGAKTFGTIGGAVGKLILAGSTSGSTILDAAAVAGSTTMVLPSASGTLVNAVTTGNGVSAVNTNGALAFTLGAITPTTVNGNTFTTGSSTYTGTAAQTYTFPTTSATIARTDAANTFTGIQTFNTPIAAGSVATMSATVGGGVPTPPNNTTTFLRGDGTFAAPATTTQKSTVVSGTQDSANKVFTIANTVVAGSEQVYINGQLLMPGSSNDYVYNGTTTITFQSAFTAPASTDVIRVYGSY